MVKKVCTVRAVVSWVLWLSIKRTMARSWKDIELLHDMNEPDHAGLAFLQLHEQQLFDESAAGNATESPAAFNATESPAVSPSTSGGDRLPTTNAPSPSPSAIPSSVPSFLPSAAPSVAPSNQPTMDPYPQVDPPQNPDKGYFNYDGSPGSVYGPERWGSVDLPDKYYWDEFGSNGFGTWKGFLQDRNPDANWCENGDFQSPIDVRDSGAPCDEIHEIRDSPGDYALTDEQVEKRIEANKLRLFYSRRPCPDAEDPKCREPSNPPIADFPNGWPKTADGLHIDFKVPAEHMIGGERFDAEMQIFHLHPLNKRVAALSTLIRAQTDGFNYYLQEALNAFQRVFDENQANCATNNILQQTGRTFGSDFNETEDSIGNTSSFGFNEAWSGDPSMVHGVSASTPSTIVSSPSVLRSHGPSAAPAETIHNRGSRDLQVKGVWNPYHEMLIPTIHFYRYDGSLTEPPCGEFVSWWISDKPMIMSFEQLEQWKTIQFTNVDKSSCKKTSVHAGRSVARPIQETNGRKVWQCTPGDFGPDPK